MKTIDVSADVFETIFQRNEEARTKVADAALLEAALAGLVVLVRNAPKDQGLLRQSGHAEKTPSGAAITFDAPHAGIVELGSRPHMPPLDPLIEWVRRHADLFGVSKDDEGEIDSIARGIQFKINAVGTKPTFWVRDSIPRLREILVRIVSERMATT